MTPQPTSLRNVALVAHVVGVMGRWGRTVNRGIVVPRDRDAEFTSTGTVEEVLALLALGRARLHDDARAADLGAAPVNPPTGRDRPAYATQGAVLLHVYEELAQHLGHVDGAGLSEPAQAARLGLEEAVGGAHACLHQRGAAVAEPDPGGRADVAARDRGGRHHGLGEQLLDPFGDPTHPRHRPTVPRWRR